MLIMTTGKRLKRARKEAGLTQEQLGEKLNFKWDKVRNIEIGRTVLKVEIAQKIGEILNVNAWWLLTGEGEMLKEDNEESIPQIDVKFNSTKKINLNIEINGNVNIIKK